MAGPEEIVGRCDVLNEPSRRLLVMLGMVLEGRTPNKGIDCWHLRPRNCAQETPYLERWRGKRPRRPEVAMTKTILVMVTAILLAGVAGAGTDWPWGDELDAVAAAPESHRVLLENDSVRVLEVLIRPGEREPAHTHRWPSVMMVTEPARLRYYGADGELRFESPPRREGQEEAPNEQDADWMGPEGLHSVENIDDRPFRALRVELKEPTS